MFIHLLTGHVARRLHAITPLHMLLRALVRVLLTDLIVSSSTISNKLLFFITVYLHWSKKVSAAAQMCNVEESVVAHQNHNLPVTAQSGSVAYSISTHCVV